MSASMVSLEGRVATGSFAADVAANVRATAAARGLNQSDLARALGWASTTVSIRWRGKREWQLSDLEAIAPLLGTTASALCAARDSNPEPASSEHADVIVLGVAA